MLLRVAGSIALLDVVLVTTLWSIDIQLDPGSSRRMLDEDCGP
jgi:hypothetical protein